MPKKIVYAAAAVIAVILYVFYADYLLSLSLKAVSGASGTAVNEKVIYVNGNFNAESSAAFIKKTGELKNSVTLFMPDIFSKTPGDFMAGEDFNGLENAQKKYQDFSFLLAEAEGFVPVVYNRYGETGAAGEDISQYIYFSGAKYKGSPRLFSAGTIENKRLWLSSRNAGFFSGFKYTPFKIPALYSVKGGIIISAPAEALRKYYKLPRSRIGVEDGKLKIGDITGAALNSTGEMAVPVYAGRPEVISPDKFIAMDAQEADNRIIIVSDSDSDVYSMQAAGAAVSMMLDRGKITFDRVINYIAAALIMLLAAGAYLKFGIGAGFPLFVFIQFASAAAFYWLYISGIYGDYPAVSFGNIMAFVLIYGYKAGSKKREMEKRKSFLRQAMPEGAAERFVKRNSDIKLRNTWLKADVVYFSFGLSHDDPADLKKDFQFIQKTLHAAFKDVLTSASGSGELTAIIFGEADRKKVVEILGTVRDEIKSGDFNILINTTEVYVFDRGGELAFLEKDGDIRKKAYILPLKKYMLVAEKEIQQYVNITKFQQIPGYENSKFFNLAGLRGEA